MKIFVSSTFLDLQDHRKSVVEAIARLGQEAGHMEVFGAGPSEPESACSDEIRDCDLFVGIYAHWYGYVPVESKISITESEFEVACRLEIPIFTFVVDDDHAWPPKFIEGEPGRTKLDRFKTDLGRALVFDRFTTPADLAAKVATALGRHLIEQRIRPLSHAIQLPVHRIYVASGTGIVLVMLGTLLLLTAAFANSFIVSFVLALIGTAIIGTVVGIAYYHEHRRVSAFNRAIMERQELLDTIQRVGIQTTTLAGTLQSLAFKNASIIADTVTMVREQVRGIADIPVLNAIPLARNIADLADHQQIVRAHDLSNGIVDTTAKTRDVITNVQTALVASDPEPMVEYLKALQDMTDDVERLLAS